jgi:heat shock protein HslJ
MTALAGGFSIAMARLTRAHDATPTPMASAIPPLRWELQRIASNNQTLTPDEPANYWIQLLPDGKVWLKADCNQGGGSYTLDGNSLSFSELVTTRVACAEGSIADDFVKSLGYVAAWQIVGDVTDELVLQMMADGGSLTFRPALTGVVWEWVRFEGGDGSVVTAADPARYTLAFQDDGSVDVKADCNTGSGQANVSDSSLDLTVATTEIACPPDSQANDFLRYLDEAVTFVIADGMLHLALPADAGIASFRPVVPEQGAATPEAMS